PWRKRRRFLVGQEELGRETDLALLLLASPAWKRVALERLCENRLDLRPLRVEHDGVALRELADAREERECRDRKTQRCDLGADVFALCEPRRQGLQLRRRYVRLAQDRVESRRRRLL